MPTRVMPSDSATASALASSSASSTIANASSVPSCSGSYIACTLTSPPSEHVPYIHPNRIWLKPRVPLTYAWKAFAAWPSRESDSTFGDSCVSMRVCAAIMDSTVIFPPVSPRASLCAAAVHTVTLRSTE